MCTTQVWDVLKLFSQQHVKKDYLFPDDSTGEETCRERRKVEGYNVMRDRLSSRQDVAWTTHKAQPEGLVLLQQ